jgi:hypothetical protein
MGVRKYQIAGESGKLPRRSYLKQEKQKNIPQLKDKCPSEGRKSFLPGPMGVGGIQEDHQEKGKFNQRAQGYKHHWREVKSSSDGR